MKYKTQFIQSFRIAVLMLLLSNCEKTELKPSTDSIEKNSVVEKSSVTINVIEPCPSPTPEIIDINTTDYTSNVQVALSGRSPLTIANVFTLGTAMQTGTNSTLTKLVGLQKFKFNSDEQQDTRRPQGVANYGNYVVTSWYFIGNFFQEGYCKLTVADKALGKYFNVVPVRFHSLEPTKFTPITTHAGGMTVIDHFLYITDNVSESILVFDLNKIYKIIKPSDPAVANQTGQDFIYNYTYMVPQVGKIGFKPLSEAKASYMSLTEINAVKHFVIGNFYSTEEGENYGGGCKSMIWLLPVLENSPYPFPIIQTSGSGQYTQLEPLFPSGPNINTTVTRIQGAIVKDNVLILNRSYQAETYQLIVMQYSNILAASPVLTSYFSGTLSNKHSYDHKNWLQGCEDWEYYNGRIWTVTESPAGFLGNRALHSADYNDILNLMAPI